MLVRDSAVDRRREVAPDAYAELPAEAQGRVEYYRSGGGRQTLTTRENYERLASEKKGRIRYFQRERPRLAEVEVWTAGDNINYQRVARGGETRLRANADKQNPQGSGRLFSLAEVVTDGDYSTAANFSAFGNRVNTFFEDLGTHFWVDTVHFLTEGGIGKQTLEVSDGELAPDGSILWTELVTQAKGDWRILDMEPTRLRFLRSRFSTQYSASIPEVMLYGEGYVAEVALTSEVIELGPLKSLVSIEWEADTPAGHLGGVVDAHRQHPEGGTRLSQQRRNRGIGSTVQTPSPRPEAGRGPHPADSGRHVEPVERVVPEAGRGDPFAAGAAGTCRCAPG